MLCIKVTHFAGRSQSAIGIYGDRGDEILTESSSRGPTDDYLASLTFDWEMAAAPAAEAGIRVVYPRTGLVLSRRAQLMERLVPLFKIGLGGPIGDERQWWSWITLSDVIRAFDHLIGSDLEGPVNLVGTSPVRQKQFAEHLVRAVHRPAVLPVPKLAMRLALGAEKAEAIGLSSTRVLPERLVDDGFEFSDADLETALSRMLKQGMTASVPHLRFDLLVDDPAVQTPFAGPFAWSGSESAERLIHPNRWRAP
ncbi:MAG: DUF1731 domain-containing protein [Acidimicrobiia bacterium]|nr:DUF1731 domain-containing protein [Acidimicrobiia bacterium]